VARQPVCPSATGDANGARIIGFINPSGNVASIAPPIVLTSEMRRTIGERPERFFRLAAPCMAADCTHWSENNCTLIGRLRKEIGSQLSERDTPQSLPPCGIRHDCVWWRQDGPLACKICPRVIYNPSP
jgi:hypothetical protein